VIRSRTALGFLAAVALAGLAGCPIPQPLPSYPTTSPFPSPRIIADLVEPYGALQIVGPNCLGNTAVYALSATLGWENVTDPIEARWFVDYDKDSPSLQVPVLFSPEIIPAPLDGISTVRPVTPVVFDPYKADIRFGAPVLQQAYRDGGGLHVVELVVSNNFAAEPGDPPHLYPYRTPASTPRQFETQVFRWVFHYTPGGSCQNP
jgi:hypothetical protein